ncbi:hypothetical protein NE237_024632 [Protea cynaroides]|uniref:Uncharacterized protein n=1 Tax=Protea cynaroides TaxID=273540 RepID=A0A9Q0H2L4_9MAGN|nr:hypothetical protein NE237_024632 [Protea cynaroides]
MRAVVTRKDAPISHVRGDSNQGDGTSQWVPASFSDAVPVEIGRPQGKARSPARKVTPNVGGSGSAGDWTDDGEGRCFSLKFAARKGDAQSRGSSVNMERYLGFPSMEPKIFTAEIDVDLGATDNIRYGANERCQVQVFPISHVASVEEAVMSIVFGLAAEEGSGPLLSHVIV